MRGLGIPGGFSEWVYRRIPGQLVIQLTDRCNGACPQCGMRVGGKYPRCALSVDEGKRILDEAARRGVRVVSFTGGEPLLVLRELISLIRHAGRLGIPYIRTGTNGFVFMNSEHPGFETRIQRIGEALADTPLRNFWISLDSSVPGIHEQMRGFPGIIRGMEKALKIFHDHGIYPSANLGINRNMAGEKTASVGIPWRLEDGERARCFYERYREAFRRFYRFVIQLGFTMVSSCYPMSMEEYDESEKRLAVYAAASTDSIVRYTRWEKALLFKALLETVPEYRPHIRVFSPLSSLHALYRQYAYGREPYPCLGGKAFFFISARDGDTYPCGFRGSDNLGKFQDVPWGSLKDSQRCSRCDWECFRDPSELMGPPLELLTDPLAFLRNWGRRSVFFRLWIRDLMYSRACDFFNGRKAPNLDRMLRFTTGKEGKRKNGWVNERSPVEIPQHTNSGLPL